MAGAFALIMAGFGSAVVGGHVDSSTLSASNYQTISETYTGDGIDGVEVTRAYDRNLDDDGEFRPGQQAATQHHAVAPLVTAQLTKQEIRHLAREANLSLADKPASACLASRIEYGRPVTRENLSQVEQAEAALHRYTLKLA